MIIRLTVGDNDFSEQIESYLNNFSLYIRELMPEFDLGENMTYEQMNKRFGRQREISRLLNPNIMVPLTEDDKRIIVNQVIYTFYTFCDKYFDSATAQYLKNKLNVQVLEHLEDKWENGEVFYWFQHGDKYILL